MLKRELNLAVLVNNMIVIALRNPELGFRVKRLVNLIYRGGKG